MNVVSYVRHQSRSVLARGLARCRRRVVRKSLGRGLEVLEGRELLSTLAVAGVQDSEARGLDRALVRAEHRVDARAMDSHAVVGDVLEAGGEHDSARRIASSTRHRMGRSKQAATVTYYSADSVSLDGQPVTGWQGIRGAGAKGQSLITGTSGSNGLLFVGSISGAGVSYSVNVPGASTTSVYGPNNLGGGRLQLVGSYKNPDYSTSAVKVNGFVYQGTTADLAAGGGAYRTIDDPGGEFTYVHSTMGGLAVGNSDGPTANGLPLGPGKAFIYSLAKNKFVGNVVFPGSLSDTAYGIWHNGGASYTICGGYSNSVVNNMNDQSQPIGQGYLVDYNSATGRFTHWTSFTDPAGVDLATHFQGISGGGGGVYTLGADSALAGSNHPLQGSLVTVKRKPNGTFGKGVWVNLNDPGYQGVTSANAVFKNQVVGIVIESTGLISYQATVQ